jgi:hypothetical protein
MEKEVLKYRSTFTANPSDVFWACPVKGCSLSHLHEVGLTHDEGWKHVLADFYLAESAK